MDRTKIIERIRARQEPWDMIVIGGGATGVGCALDAASRGFDVLLLEQSDFGKGTSSRSTKLIHGGVRYLRQGSISLVRESLQERGILLKNAPHRVEKLAFVVPCYGVWQILFYGAGLKLYNLLSGKFGFGKSRILSKKETIARLPNIRQQGLSGGVLYFDGQFDDARLLIDMAVTADGQGAALLNHAAVIGLIKDADGIVSGVKFCIRETGETVEARAKGIINATGAFSDAVRRLSDETSRPMIAPSQGIHLVFDGSFLVGGTAMIIPKTADDRVLFAVPFHGKTLVGTTDTPVATMQLEPVALEAEIDFILKTTADYLAKAPQRSDVLSVFAGIRPLVDKSASTNTAELSRDHSIEIDGSNLVTIAGGKWTTYRRMAEDAVDQAAGIAGLPAKPCATKELRIDNRSGLDEFLRQNPDLSAKLRGDLPFRRGDVIYAVRNEMGRTVEDLLARRLGLLYLDAAAAIELAPLVAEIMAAEMGRDKAWIREQLKEFNETAAKYLLR